MVCVQSHSRSVFLSWSSAPSSGLHFFVDPLLVTFGLLLPLHELLPEQINDNFLFARAPQCALGMLSKPCVLLSLYCQLVCSHLQYCPPCFWEECKNSSNILASFQNHFSLSTIFKVLLSSRNLKLLVLLDWKECHRKKRQLFWCEVSTSERKTSPEVTWLHGYDCQNIISLLSNTYPEIPKTLNDVERYSEKINDYC